MDSETSPAELLSPTVIVHIPNNAMDAMLLTLQATMDGVFEGKVTPAQAFAIGKLASEQIKAVDLAFRMYKELT